MKFGPKVHLRSHLFFPEIIHLYAAVCSPACEVGYTCVAPNACRRGVQLMLGGVNYPNNSIIQFDGIYYTSDHCHSLLCTTDKVPCCSNSRAGNWYHVQSNGIFITALSSTIENDYYQSRGDDGTLRLIRQDDTTPSTNMSFYCCQLPDATLFMQTLCVTIGTVTVTLVKIVHVLYGVHAPFQFYTPIHACWCYFFLMVT